jgi:nucleotide-binding universal stress UspA family protein
MPGRRIVVGVDGSPSSRAALQWAVRQAELTGSSVEAVIAWHYPLMFGGYAWAPIAAIERTSFDDIARKLIADAVGDAVNQTVTVQIASTVRQGDPAQVLLHAAEGAEMLVVGSRGHGGFAGALLGSVSERCAMHALCPVVIVRSANFQQA